MELLEKIGSSGKTRTNNPPVNSLVRSRNFKNLAQMATYGHAWTRKVTSNVTLI